MARDAVPVEHRTSLEVVPELIPEQVEMPAQASDKAADSIDVAPHDLDAPGGQEASATSTGQPAVLDRCTAGDESPTRPERTHMSIQDEITKRITSLNASLPDIRGVIVASADGLVIAADLPGGIDPERVAAMAATSIGLGERISSTLSIGVLDEQTVKASDGSMHLFVVGSDAVLALLSAPGANLGLLNLEARTTARDLSKLFG
jgi:uncharacterized protein